MTKYDKKQKAAMRSRKEKHGSSNSERSWLEFIFDVLLYPINLIIFLFER